MKSHSKRIAEEIHKYMDTPLEGAQPAVTELYDETVEPKVLIREAKAEVPAKMPDWKNHGYAFAKSKIMDFRDGLMKYHCPNKRKNNHQKRKFAQALEVITISLRKHLRYKMDEAFWSK